MGRFIVNGITTGDFHPNVIFAVSQFVRVAFDLLGKFGTLTVGFDAAHA
jgi:hypothetical protein